MDLFERLRRLTMSPTFMPPNGNGSSEAPDPPAPTPNADYVSRGTGMNVLGPDTAPAVSQPSTEGDLEADDVAPVIDSQNVVHHVLKGLDVWSKIEVSVLERAATEQALSLAERGLPRHDLDTDESLNIEQVLAARANEIYLTWIRKARRRIEAAIARETRRVSDALAQATLAMESYRGIERALGELAPRSQKPINVEHPAHESAETVQPADDEVQWAERHLHRWFWPLSIGLVLAEFIANAPIFAELFPSSLEIETRVNNWLANDRASIAWLGLRKLGVQLMTSPEPAILALAIVTFFLFLGHKCGESARTVVVAWRPHPRVSEKRRFDLLRQAIPVGVLCGLGALIMLGVLFVSRDSVLPVAKERMASASVQATTAEAAFARAVQENNDAAITKLREDTWKAGDERDHRSRRLEYAASISRLNAPILGLNLVLVIVAIVAGYFRLELKVPAEETARTDRAAVGRNLSKVTGEDPTARLATLRNLLGERRREANEAIGRAELSYARVQQLLHCDPVAQWEAMVERLGSVISVFRSENAKARHLDTRDIRAFHKAPTHLQLVQPVPTPVPSEVQELIAAQHLRLERLSRDFLAIAGGARAAERPGGEARA